MSVSRSLCFHDILAYINSSSKPVVITDRKSKVYSYLI